MKKNIRFYSAGVPKILIEEDRARIAKQIQGVLKAHLGTLRALSCLDIGCSSGVITNLLADQFKKVIGIDVDQEALIIARQKYNKKNLKFIEMDGEELNFKNDSFDVVICSQIYNFVNDSNKLMEEIHRVIKLGGVCYFSSRNKYSLIEPQYNLPFLSWLPLKIARFYLKQFSGSDKYFGYKYLSYWGLKKLVSNFRIHDYTLRILMNPQKYNFDKLSKVYEKKH